MNFVSGEVTRQLAKVDGLMPLNPLTLSITVAVVKYLTEIKKWIEELF